MADIRAGWRGGEILLNMAERTRGVAVLQVLLAMLFLAIIGGSGGYLAAHHQKQREVAAPQSGPPSTQASSPSPSVPSPSASPSPVVLSGSACPQHTVDLAGTGPLHRLLYIRTSYSEVWICQDGQGVLYYQGHLWAKGADLVEGTSALFLTNCVNDPDVPGGYIATNNDSNGTAEYHVSRKQLLKVIKGVQQAPEPVLSYQGG